MYSLEFIIFFTCILAWSFTTIRIKWPPKTRDVSVQTEEEEDSDSTSDEDDRMENVKNVNNVLQALHYSLTPPVSPTRVYECHNQVPSSSAKFVFSKNLNNKTSFARMLRKSHISEGKVV
jgi:hypothetical protein